MILQYELLDTQSTNSLAGRTALGTARHTQHQQLGRKDCARNCSTHTAPAAWQEVLCQEQLEETHTVSFLSITQQTPQVADRFYCAATQAPPPPRTMATVISTSLHSQRVSSNRSGNNLASHEPPKCHYRGKNSAHKVTANEMPNE